jgi:hypothetical protein
MTAARFEQWTERLIVIGDQAYLPDEWKAIPHGTSSGYVHWQCRCEDCCEWRSRYYNKRTTR